MSIKDGKVFLYISKHRNRLIVGALICIQMVFSVILSISLAGHLIWPERSSAAAGTPMQIAYEGRLTDSSGNALGGTGTLYCYRFSIYDASTAGNKLWPGGTPAQTTATTTDGIFNAVIGQTDTLSSTVFDFSTTSTAYLQVEVNTTTSTCGGSWEALLPRQSVLSSGYALQSNNIYGALLKTDTVNNRVQIGTGAGTPSPVYLGLDFRNSVDYVGQSCSTNGLMWYNSANSQALICEGGLIQNVGTAATTTIAAINANVGTPANAGTVVFSNSNGVSFGINGNTVTASVAAGGGGGLTLAYWPTMPLPLASSTNNSGTTAAGTNITASFHVSPLVLEDAVSFSRVNLWVSNITIAGTATGSINRNVGIYTLNGGTALSLLSSFMFRQEVTQNSVTAQSHRFYWGTNSTSNSSSSGGNISANFAGVRAIPIFTGNTSLSAGKYYLVYGQVNVSAGSNVFTGYNNMYVSYSQTTAGQLGSAVSLAPFPLMGQFSSTSAFGNLTSPFMPSSINTTAITNTGGTSQWKSNYIHFIGTQV